MRERDGLSGAIPQATIIGPAVTRSHECFVILFRIEARRIDSAACDRLLQFSLTLVREELTLLRLLAVALYCEAGREL